MYAMNEEPPATIDDLLTGQFAPADELNPPDVDPMGLLDRGHAPVDLGVAGAYARTMYATVASSRAYHELGGLCMVATAIQHRWLPLTWAHYGKQRANVYGCILGRSSFDHKSTALLKIGEHMPWENMLNAARLPGMFTEEGLYKELADKPHGLVIRDEIGMLFASRQRKYTEFVIPFLTDAFGGWLNAKRLSAASYESREVALSIIGATTYSEFTRTTTEGDWDSGWLVRWLFALPDPDYDATRDGRWPTGQDSDLLNRVRQTLADLNSRPASPMQADADALEHLATWRKALIRQAVANSERHERVDAIIERYATYAYKFSMILCAARGDGERVTVAHAQDGARLAENYMTNIYRLYQYQREHKLTGALLQKALAILNKQPEGLTGRELGRVLHVDATMRDEVIQRLMEFGAISDSKTGKTTIYRAALPKLPAARLNTGHDQFA
jgi:hypothetical protein